MKLRITVRPAIRFNVKPYSDRRGAREMEAAQALADSKLEKYWRAKVANHPIERNRLARERSVPVQLPSILRRQAG